MLLNACTFSITCISCFNKSISETILFKCRNSQMCIRDSLKCFLRVFKYRFSIFICPNCKFFSMIKKILYFSGGL